MRTLLLAVLFLSAQARAEDVVVAKSRFLDEMKAGLPASFCAEKAYFRKCFSGTKEDCEKTAKAATESCATKLAAGIPAQLHQPADGQAAGEKLGKCAGEKFEADRAKAKLATPECSDASKWK